MPKRKSYNPESLTTLAMQRFWAHGFYASSMDDLVKTTGVSRHGLYSSFKDKRGLFAAAVERYFDLVVTPAFLRVESGDAGLAEIEAYFEQQIALAEKHGLPGPGCLVANTMVESAPHDAAFRELVMKHLDRLNTGFRHAIENEAKRRGRTGLDAAALASFLTISAQGLWSASRMISDAAVLRLYVKQLLAPIKEMLA